MLNKIDIPLTFNRNDPAVAAIGAEETGQILIDLATQEAGRSTLEDANVLDIGCGVRFTQTIINRAIPIKSYSGIEVSPEIVEFLKENVEPHDSRFRYAHWDVQNDMYNKVGSVQLTNTSLLPLAGKYDIIWLFSVFTHLNLADSNAMLGILRNNIEPDGKLIFSAFIDPELDGFEDRLPGRPLVNAYFGLETMLELLNNNGWKVDKHHERDFKLPIVDYFVCSIIK